jgi:7-cyano-7-deazaguanine reductase
MNNKTQDKDLEGLSDLGKGKTKPSKNLEVFPNHHPNRDYIIELYTDEFTCLCPATGQPDFVSINIKYIPEQKIVESKSLKLYFWSYRNEGCFHEHLANVILDDLIIALDPRWMKVEAKFAARGGIGFIIHAEHQNKNYKSS